MQEDRRENRNGGLGTANATAVGNSFLACEAAGKLVGPHIDSKVPYTVVGTPRGGLLMLQMLKTVVTMCDLGLFCVFQRDRGHTSLLSLSFHNNVHYPCAPHPFSSILSWQSQINSPDHLFSLKTL